MKSEQEQMDLLIQLQKNENETSQIKTRISNNEKRNTELDQMIVNNETTIQEKENEFKELQRKYRSYDSDLKMHLTKQEKQEQRLREVRSNKEYELMLKEIDDLKALSSKLEDEMISFLDLIDEQEKAILSQKKAYEELKIAIHNEKKLIEVNNQKNEELLKELSKIYDEIIPEIDHPLLERYTYLQKTCGRAIVSVSNEMCCGCYMNIPPQMYIELQRTKTMRFCPRCQRIIYWEGYDVS
ncbi:MAG: hypothetical protein HQK77_18250 [Desulfobacterales bacterium]|nr:hypothetical protein [Desulfobacterales bacterium]